MHVFYSLITDFQIGNPGDNRNPGVSYTPLETQKRNSSYEGEKGS
jgi:hypothetical protein